MKTAYKVRRIEEHSAENGIHMWHFGTQPRKTAYNVVLWVFSSKTAYVYGAFPENGLGGVPSSTKTAQYNAVLTVKTELPVCTTRKHENLGFSLDFLAYTCDLALKTFDKVYKDNI